MKKIAIIEDDADLRNLLRIILTAEGYVVEVYADGHSHMDGETSLADLYVMDINLGRISGLDLCRLLKGKSQTKKIPVIIISANAELRTLADEAGADDTLPKPFTTDQLLTKIRAHL